MAEFKIAAVNRKPTTMLKNGRTSILVMRWEPADSSLFGRYRRRWAASPDDLRVRLGLATTDRVADGASRVCRLCVPFTRWFGQLAIVPLASFCLVGVIMQRETATSVPFPQLTIRLESCGFQETGSPPFKLRCEKILRTAKYPAPHSSKSRCTRQKLLKSASLQVVRLVHKAKKGAQKRFKYSEG
jgi:hypothetical protein